MSVESKQFLLKDIKKALADRMTANDLIRSLSDIENLLTGYEVESIKKGDSGNSFKELMEYFLDAKRIEGRSDKTIYQYRSILQRLSKDVDVPIERITVFTLRSWMSSEKDRGTSDRTLANYRFIFSSFFGWLYDEGLLTRNPCSNLNTVKFKKEVRQPYSSIEIELLKENCKTLRDKAIISFLLSTGCRVSEMCDLDRKNVDFNNLECTVLGKGNKERTVYFDDVTAMLLKRYLDSRTDDDPSLFASSLKKRITTGGVRKMLNGVAKRAGIENVHPHRFRRTMATNLIDHGMSIQEVGAILGHEKVDTTMTYVYVNKNNVKNAYQKYM